MSINLPTFLNVIFIKNIFEIIIFRFDLLNIKKFIFYLFRDLWMGKCAHVLESKTNLTKFTRFYLLILSHTSIITNATTNAVAASRYCNHNYTNIFDFNHHTITTVTTQPLLSLLLSLLLLLLLLRLLLLLLFTTYCMPSVQARTKRFSFIPRLSSRL